MKISALIPTYNRHGYVQRAIRSILAQMEPVDEIIVVDDGSTDGTAEEIEREFGESVRVIGQLNQGVAGARRRGVLEAAGDWVAFLDSDDEWTRDRNRILRQAIAKVPADVAWIFGNTQEITDAGEGSTQYEQFGFRVAEAVHVVEDPLSVQHPWQFGILQSSVIKREVLVELKCFSENLRHSEDRLAGIQVACRYGFAAIPNIVTRRHRTSDLAASSLAIDPNLRVELLRAEMEAFSLVARTVRRQPWGELYAESVRGMCKERSSMGDGFRRLSLQQFRYGVSGKSVAFFCAAMFGGAGLGLWKRAALVGQTAVSRSAGTAGNVSTELPK